MQDPTEKRDVGILDKYNYYYYYYYDHCVYYISPVVIKIFQ
jgi:hypothetical protein